MRVESICVGVHRKGMLSKTVRMLLLCWFLFPAASTVWGDGEARVLPPPNSGLAAPSAEDLLLAPPEELLTDPNQTEGLLEESITEAMESVPELLVEPARWYQPTYWFGPAPWDIGFELGINGSEGVNEALSLRSGGHLRRKTRNWKIDSSLVYNKNTANSVETQNNALLDLRLDRFLKDSPWSLFFLHQTLYDEFQAYDLRISANAGLGYECSFYEAIETILRVGAGTSREFGGPDDTWAPEALFGLEYTHQLTKMQRLAAKLDYYPQWDDFNQYRAVADIGWEIDLDRPKNLSLKFSIVDRYDSTPNGVQPNELNYSALLIWGL